MARPPKPLLTSFYPTIPKLLKERSRAAAQMREEPLARYGRLAVKIMNFASREGFDASTEFVTLTGLSRMPPFKTEQYGGRKTQISVPLAVEELAEMRGHAERLGITVDERFGRSLGLANYLVGISSKPMGAITAIHQGEEKIIIL